MILLTNKIFNFIWEGTKEKKTDVDFGLWINKKMLRFLTELAHFCWLNKIIFNFVEFVEHINNNELFLYVQSRQWSKDQPGKKINTTALLLQT